MPPHAPPKRALGASLALVAALALASTGCPDTSVSDAPDAAAATGKLELLQTIAADPGKSFDLPRSLAVSPDDTHVYVAASQASLATFARGADGSLSAVPEFSMLLLDGWGLAALSLPSGDHLYATGGDPTALHHYLLDKVSGKPLGQTYLSSGEVKDEVTVAAQGAVLVVGSDQTSLLSYLVDPQTGVLALGPSHAHQSPGESFTILAHPDEPAVFVTRRKAAGSFSLVRYAVDPAKGTLTEQGEAAADLAGGLAYSAMCAGTTRVYVPQKGGSIGYADVSGTGITLAPGFDHPDLAGASSVTLSADCKTAYAVAGTAPNRTLVTLARAASGDLTWRETLRTGPGTSLPGFLAPILARTAKDGKNVYVFSSAGEQAIAVFRRD